jgi:hypothetical protein
LIQEKDKLGSGKGDGGRWGRRKTFDYNYLSLMASPDKGFILLLLPRLTAFRYFF